MYVPLVTPRVPIMRVPWKTPTSSPTPKSGSLVEFTKSEIGVNSVAPMIPVMA